MTGAKFHKACQLSEKYSLAETGYQPKCQKDYIVATGSYLIFLLS